MNTSITKIEYYLPEKILTNQELESIFPEWDAEKIEKKTGIRSRHIVLKNETALDLSLKAAIKVLKDYEKEKIDFLLFCTQSPD